jgi:hypothetical protein
MILALLVYKRKGSEKMETKNLLLGSEIVVKCLEEQGIKHVFSYY